MPVTGWPRATVIRGTIVMQDHEVQGPPLGCPFRFQETLEGGVTDFVRDHSKIFFAVSRKNCTN